MSVDVLDVQSCVSGDGKDEKDEKEDPACGFQSDPPSE
jgi:hypothetical protein